MGERGKGLMMTDVFDASTGEIYATYSLPPKEALVAAWEQHHKNFDTWEYAKKIESEVYHLKKGKYGWSLGKFRVQGEWTKGKGIVEIFKE